MKHEELIQQRIKLKEVPDLRKKLLRSQRNICPLCGCTIRPDQAVLDHDHDTGRVRQVLHRQCNQIEGRVLNWVSRSGQNVHPAVFLENLLMYWQVDYSDNPVHHTHKSDVEKEIMRLKRKQKKLKSKRGKDKVRAEINAILESLI